MRSIRVMPAIALIASSSVLVAPAAAASSANGVCHVFSYTGSCFGSSSSSCTTTSYCVPSMGCNTTLLAVAAPGQTVLPASVAAAGQQSRLVKRVAVNGTVSTGVSNVTGCIGTLQGQVACDGTVRGFIDQNGVRTSYQCVCDQDAASCPSSDAVSVSFADGSYSTSNIPSSQSGAFSFTYVPQPTAASSSASASQSLAPTPLTTFSATFTIGENGVMNNNHEAGSSTAKATVTVSSEAGLAEQQQASTAPTTISYSSAERTGTACSSLMAFLLVVAVSLIVKAA